jgi:hypothetical protein
MNLLAQAKDPNQRVFSDVFIENKGQFQLPNGQKNDSILYVLKSQNVDVIVSYNSLHYFFKSSSIKVDNVLNSNNSKVGISASNLDNNGIAALSSNKKIDLYRLDMYLKGAQYPSKVKSENKVDYYENYYNLNNSAKGLTNVYGCEKIVLENVYAGIDWVIYIKNKELKYDFIVHPFADRNNIKLEFKGQTSLKLDSQGNLLVETPFGNIQEKAPQSYQDGKLINTQFEISNDIVRFNYSDEIDGAKELIVDPCLSWGTYYGYLNDYVTKNFIKNSTTPSTLQLCEKAQVLLTYNISPTLVNGSRGVITGFTSENYPIVEFIMGTTSIIKPIKFTLDYTLRNGKNKMVGYALQIPLKIAYALTVHSCQGSTLDCVSIDLRNTFEYGQAYTAMSRVGSLEGLYLKKFNYDVIQAHPDALRFKA